MDGRRDRFVGGDRELDDCDVIDVVGGPGRRRHVTTYLVTHSE